MTELEGAPAEWLLTKELTHSAHGLTGHSPARLQFPDEHSQTGLPPEKEHLPVPLILPDR